LATVRKPIIEKLVFDDDNEGKVDQHHLVPAQVLEAFADAAGVIVRNRRGRRASHLIIGRDRSGRCLAVPWNRRASRRCGAR
jgi:hypothetical protein